MKTLRALLICSLTMWSACGREDSAEPSLAESPGSDQEDNKTLLSIALQSREELPTCDDDNKNQLVYLLDEKIFLTCYNRDWIEVQIKGSDGAKGEQGLAGEKGDTGEQGEDGETVGGSMWFNPVTQKYWIVGGESTWPGSGVNPCSNGYRLPTKDETLVAVLLGLGHFAEQKNTLIGTVIIWTGEEHGSAPGTYDAIRSDDGTVGVAQTNLVPTEKHTVVCVEE